ncbi:dinitrogenase iron-molybdenum cofactor biosynthesis domain-containing protein [bacterium]|nr:dinitrogenase iron-molybdenum cofactor biosynthesis domain-containing protein [bacterium]
MKAALTIWENRISPVFDSADTLLIAEIQNNKIISRQCESFEVKRLHFLLEMLLNQDVSVFICGAISEHPARIIEAGTIKLIPFISGNTDEILDVFARGVPIVPGFLMPGCRGGACQYRASMKNEGFDTCGSNQRRYSQKRTVTTSLIKR